PSRRRHTITKRDWSSDVCSSDLFRRKEVTGHAAFSRLKEYSQSSLDTDSAVYGAWRMTESSYATFPSMISWISARIVRMASMKRSSSAISSDSVGSTIKVPATGKARVGAWKPKSIKRLATSAAVTPEASVSSRKSKMHSWATKPWLPVYKIGKESFNWFAR